MENANILARFCSWVDRNEYNLVTYLKRKAFLRRGQIFFCKAQKSVLV